MSCNTNDFRFPMQAEIYYPIIDQSAYGTTIKKWVFDRTIVSNIVPAGAKEKEELNININIVLDSIMSSRFKEDIRISSYGESYALENIVITNIRDKNCNELYLEAGGPRDGQSTLFEAATVQPFINAFGQIEHYKVILKRSENQGFDA